MCSPPLDSHEVRVLLRHYWKKGLSARAAAEEICRVEGEATVGKTAAIKWFRRFNDGDFDLGDRLRSGRPPELADDEMLDALDDMPASSTRELAAVLSVGKTTVHRHLQQQDFVPKKPRQDPHELTEAQACRRAEMCRQLLGYPLDDRFWKRIVTSDEKWIFMVNHNRQRRWVHRDESPPSVPCHNRFGEKVLLCVWWNFEGILHFELVPNGRTVNADLYCQQLDHVYDKLKVKYPALVHEEGVLFQQDGAKPHTAKRTREKFSELEGVEILPHPPYSPDAAPSDYGLFRSMEHFLRGRSFKSFGEVEEACNEFFASKPPEWYFNQIRMLADRWKSIVENIRLYFDK